MVHLDSASVLPDLPMLLSAFKRHRAGSDSWLASSAKEVLEEARGLIAPAAVWARKDYHGDEPFLPSDLPPEVLPQIEGLIGVVCTVGEALERRSRQCFEEQRFTHGYLLDHVGTLSVAILAQHVARVLSEEEKATRWAPGDTGSDWMLTTQRALFEWVPARQIGVRLSEHNVMIPAKSLSYVLLVGAQLAGRQCLIACRHCVWNGVCKQQ